jgi:hypothetical protein
VDETVTPTDDAGREKGKRRTPQLLHLNDADDFEVAKGEPDIRGWDVKSSDGQKLGKVEDLLIDTEPMRVRYVEVKLDDKIAKAEGEEHEYVLVPVGAARLDDEHDDVLVDLSAANIPGLPAYSRGKLTPEYEVSLLDRYRPAGTAGLADDRPAEREAQGDFYGSRHFDDRRFFGSRRRSGEQGPYITSSRRRT